MYKLARNRIMAFILIFGMLLTLLPMIQVAAEEPIDHTSYNSMLLNAIPVSSMTPNGSFTTTFDDNITQFNNGKWHPNWDEQDVFHMQMSHSQTGNDYSVRFGKGGQLYSIDTPIGEVMPPQNDEHAWVDDTLLAVVNQYDGQRHSESRLMQGFIHQSGAYMHYDDFTSNLGIQSFWSPLVSEHVDPINKQYTTLHWPQMSTGLSVNRSDMLIYQNTRDLGDGVLELSYMFYNYNDTYKGRSIPDRTDITTWGGIRESKLPKLIVGDQNGGWFESTAGFGAPGHLYDMEDTGGWMAATQDLNNPDGYTVAYVFGKDSLAHGDTTHESKYITIGDAGRDDFSVMSVNYRNWMDPGQSYFFRMYLVVGKLGDVAAKAEAIQDTLEYGYIEFDQTTSPTIPLYLQQIGGQTVLTENGTGTPALQVFAQPVQGSKPLFLIRDIPNNKYIVSSDPYVLNTKVNLSSADDSMKRLATRPYDGNSEVIKLFGYVMPASKIDPGLSYVRLDSILTQHNYYPKNGLYDSEIMVLSPPINDTHTGISYNGAWSYSSNRDNGDFMHDVHQTETNNDFFEYTFTGTAIDYIGVKNSNVGDQDVYIDNVLMQTVSGAASSYTPQALLYSNHNLVSGTHTIKVVKKSGDLMALDHFKVYNDTRINDTNTGISYTGNWSYSSNRGEGDFIDDVYQTQTNNNFFEYTFTGTGIDYIGVKNSNVGGQEVYIDNVLKGTISGTASSYKPQEVLYSNHNLGSGTHTIKVVKKSGDWMIVDALKVYNEHDPQIKITNTDHRAISNVKVSMDFYIDGILYTDHETIGDFDKTVNLSLNGASGSWDGTRYTGNFLSTEGSAAGSKEININNRDSRFVSYCKVTVDFYISGSLHTDYEYISGCDNENINLTLNGFNGSWDGTKYTGNFLKP